MSHRRRFSIPDVPKERILQLAERIRPIVEFSYVGRCYIEPVDIVGIAYTRDPKPACQVSGIKPLCDINTYHLVSFYSFFTPSVADVLAQIPEEHLDKVVAFEIIKNLHGINDPNVNTEAINEGYCAVTTRLYVRK